MNGQHDHTQPGFQLTAEQADVLRKHLGRETMSLDDAAILLGVHVEELAQHFQGRRAGQPHFRGDDGRERHHRRITAEGEERDFDDSGRLHAPARSAAAARPASGRNMAIWAGGTMAALAVVGGLALLSGIPQSLLFAPRGVSEHKDANAEPAAVTAAPMDDLAEAPLEPTPPPTPAVDPVAADAPPLTAEPAPGDPSATDPALADPALADPNAAPPAETAVAEAPVPPAPEEVAPAVATAESVSTFDPQSAPAAAEAPAAPGGATLLYATRPTAVRDAPASSGSNATAQLKRGDSVSGVVVTGADGKSSWLMIESGPGAGGYVSAVNLSSEARPAVVQAIGQPRAITKVTAFHSGPSEGSPTLDTLNPGINVLAAAEVDGGWIEVQKRAGGVGYIRKEAIE